MLSPIASNGTAVLLADGDVGVSVTPDGRHLVALVGSLMAMSDWEPYEGPVPSWVPASVADEIAAEKTRLGLA